MLELVLEIHNQATNNFKWEQSMPLKTFLPIEIPEIHNQAIEDIKSFSYSLNENLDSVT